jgi:hypothetical protein
VLLDHARWSGSRVCNEQRTPLRVERGIVRTGPSNCAQRGHAEGKAVMAGF